MTTISHPLPTKSPFTSKTLWSLAATGLAWALPTLTQGIPDISNSTIIGSIHGVGIPLGLVTAGVFRLLGKHKLL